MSGTQWVALLRGINLGPNKRVAMADLRALLESLGYDDVRTVLQSGNALFTTPARRSRTTLERDVSSAIRSDLGLEVAVVVRTAGEVAEVVAANPFCAAGADPKELHAAFLASAPPAAKVENLDPRAYAPDQFEMGDRVVYLRMPNGFKGSKLPDWEKVLGVPVTMRNWNTVTRLRDLTR